MQSSGQRIARFSAAAGVKYFAGNELAIEETKQLLTKFQGGSISLSKNEITGIATICLHRPDKKNAISGQMLLDLRKALEELESWSSGKGFIMYGANSTFSSGGDLTMSRETTSEDAGFAISRFVQDVTTRLRTLPMVSVALIEGVALGGGAEISVASCDWRVMASDAKIGFVHGRMGLTPGWGGGMALKRLVGSSVALDLIASGRLVSATEALQIKLVNEIIENSDSNLQQVQNWLQQRTVNSTEVLRASKILMSMSDNDLLLESMLHAPLWGGQTKIDALNKKIKHK